MYNVRIPYCPPHETRLPGIVVYPPPSNPRGQASCSRSWKPATRPCTSGGRRERVHADTGSRSLSRLVVVDETPLLARRRRTITSVGAVSLTTSTRKYTNSVESYPDIPFRHFRHLLFPTPPEPQVEKQTQKKTLSKS